MPGVYLDFLWILEGYLVEQFDDASSAFAILMSGSHLLGTSSYVFSKLQNFRWIYDLPDYLMVYGPSWPA